jgi:hypothetical protein
MSDVPIKEFRRDEHSKIQVNDGPNGREFYFPAARNLREAVPLTVISLVFSAGFFAAMAYHSGILVSDYASRFTNHASIPS